MDIGPILREIDAELEKLQQARTIVAGLAQPTEEKLRRCGPKKVVVKTALEVKPEPKLIILPPTRRRGVTRRVKAVAAEPKALAAPVSSAPIFVAKTRLASPVAEPPKNDEAALEAAMRQKLLGGAA